MQLGYVKEQWQLLSQILEELRLARITLNQILYALAGLPAPAAAPPAAAPPAAPEAYELVRGTAPVELPPGGERVLYSTSGSGVVELVGCVERKAAGAPSLQQRLALDGAPVADLASADYRDMMMPPVPGFGGMLFHEVEDGAVRVGWVRLWGARFAQSAVVSVVNTDTGAASTLERWFAVVRRRL